MEKERDHLAQGRAEVPQHRRMHSLVWVWKGAYQNRSMVLNRIPARRAETGDGRRQGRRQILPGIAEYPRLNPEQE